ncbi:phosphotransferase enzyme family protein [Fictibacillus sp. BK138]|uniref:phosphotransferase enzyme family protein n=1 Tax=Fictibacillus sp. BK138 TaxID=2512121 RepID=UPI001028AF3F|nr:phosphotransferase [Fictibacillus sp. BK138]RZT23870.1 Ser/Thr protein kinase RdoA (MazF antagonist) [Fictibacillus sp. BK138]
MMKLSTMLKVASTVNSEWRSSIAEKILEDWDYDEGSVYAFRYSANFLFVFKNDGETYFLRFNEVSERELSLLDAEMEILDYLAGTSLRTVRPALSLNGKKVERVEVENGIYYASVFKALPGKQYEINELEQDQFFIWGKTLGKLHAEMKKCGEAAPFNRLTWRDHLNSAESFLPMQEIAAKKELACLLNWAETLPVTQENFGLIHYDFELDNQCWEDDVAGILDFDDCAYYWYAADIAYALRDLEDQKMTNPLFAEFVTGYESETMLDADLVEQLPMFNRFHDLMMFVKLLRSVDIPDSADHPEWISNLRKKLVEKIEKYRSSFERLHANNKELLK